MRFKIKFLGISLLCLKMIHTQDLIGSATVGIEKKIIIPIEDSEFISLDADNDFEEMHLDSVVAGFLNSATKRLAVESSMAKKSTIIAKETASIYELADEIGLDPVIAVNELKAAFFQEYPEVIAWQYLDERIKNKTRQANKPEWTDAQLQELAKAQVVYARLLQLSKEAAGFSSQNLRDNINNILIEYPHFHPWIQESLRNNASQFFYNNRNELDSVLQSLYLEKQYEQLFHRLFPVKSFEFPLIVNLNQAQRDYYAQMGFLGLASVENQNIVIDDPLEVKKIIDGYLQDEQVSEMVASYLVSQKAQYNKNKNPLLRAEMLMRSSVSIQNLAETQKQKQALKNLFEAYFHDEIKASKNYLEQNIATENIMNLLSPNRWSHNQRKKMNDTLYRVYLRSQELKQQAIDNHKKSDKKK